MTFSLTRIFVQIADRVEVTVDLKGRRTSGPPVVAE